MSTSVSADFELHGDKKMAHMFFYDLRDRKKYFAENANFVNFGTILAEREREREREMATTINTL